MKAILPGAALIVGIVLLAAGLLWAIFFPPGRGWTEAKSARMTELGDRAGIIKLQLSQSQTRPTMHAGQNPAELKEEYDKISVEYKALHEEFVGANNAPKTAARFLQWAGIAFVAAGGFIVFVNRGS